MLQVDVTARPKTSWASRARFAVGAVSALLAITAATAARGDDWTRFRGPNGAGQSDADTIPAKWSEKDENWRVKLPGIGHSSPVVWQDKVFVTSAEEQGARRLLLCLSTHDGRLLWKKQFDAVTHGVHAQNSFASSTPAVDEKHVYVAWATPAQFNLVALNHDGRQAWQADLGPYTSQHGFGTSPIVHNGLVVIANDQDGASSLSAYDRNDGKPRWRVPRRTSSTAYSTPCVRRAVDGNEELIFASEGSGLAGINPATGSTNWELEVFNQRTVASPVLAGDLILANCGAGGGARNYVVAVRPGPSPAIAYRIDRSAPYVPTLLAHGDLAFLWGDNGVVTCIEAANGKKVWQQRVGGNFSGSPVRAGQRLYCISVDGEVVVVAASRQYELLGRTPLGELSRSTPAVADGAMYLRTESQLVSIGGPRR